MCIESECDLKGLLRAGKVVSSALREMRERVQAGVTTLELDQAAAEVLAHHGATSAPRLLYGFPGTACISVNDEAVHGIPGPRRIQAGDLVKLDVTALLDGYIADAAITVPVLPVSSRRRLLCECAESALNKAILVARAGSPINAIGKAVETEVEGAGFTVLRQLGGHGVGRAIHEEPHIPNYYEPRLRNNLREGQVITIEPIISTGSWRIKATPDRWTIKTGDGSDSAHFEHTLLITRDEPLILTAA